MQPMQPAQKKSGGAGLWWLFGCLGCFGFVAIVGAIGLAFFLVRAQQDEAALYGPVGIQNDPYVDPYADPYDPGRGGPYVPPAGGGGLGAGLGADEIVRYRVPVYPDDPRRGPEDAPVTIVEFGDFQCPFCARAAATIAQIEREYAGQVRVVWKNNPLPFHTDAMPAAAAALEARAQQGDPGFWRVHDRLYADTRALTRADLERYAADLGLDVAGVRGAIDLRRYAAQIERDQELARQIGATGTPTFYVNGRELRGAQPVESFRTLVDAEVAQARALEATGIPRARIYDELTRNGRTTPAPREPVAGTAREPEDENRVYRVPVGDAPQRGPDDALVTIVAFSEFQCPFCSRVRPTLDRITEQYGSDVRIVFKHYPLPFHQHAQAAAEVAVEVRSQRGDAAFWRMHDVLFENQRELSEAALVRYARQAGASGTGVQRALSTGAHRATVERDMELGRAQGSLGTPTFFINGKKLAGAQPFESFAAVIDRELASARALVAAGTPRARVYETILAGAQ